MAGVSSESISSGSRCEGIPGGTMLTVAVLLLTVPLIEGPHLGWPAWVCLDATAPALAGFLTYEQRVNRRGGDRWWSRRCCASGPSWSGSC